MLSFLHGVEYDCSNGPVIHQAFSLDKCGVCGGDGTSCLDCRGILYGDSTYDCGICVDNRNSSNSQLRDCVGVCGGNNTVLAVEHKEVCIRKGDEQALFPCKGVGNASTYINSCGHCVGGNTGLPSDFGQDLCGVCNGNNECVGCDGVPNSGWILDNCGECNPSGHISGMLIHWNRRS
ncbi:keratin-associated protein 5-3-like, partial [Limulus polyphemus]|uniref:Keratin-associated protein 5-3-like n=1 Tax=Limulus polyphemus TaxID=6850 RepID=A0ABM1SGM3_LIMPO